MNKVEALVRKHPRVYFNYMTFVVFVMGLLAKYLNGVMLHFILMKGLDPNPPPPQPPPPPPEPKVERKQIQIPYVPTWVAASFKDRTKHPLFNVKMGGPTKLSYNSIYNKYLPSLDSKEEPDVLQVALDNSKAKEEVVADSDILEVKLLDTEATDTVVEEVELTPVAEESFDVSSETLEEV